MKWTVILLDCAWVLWLYSLPGWDWSLVNASPAHQECVAAIHRKLADYKQLGYTVTGSAVEKESPAPPFTVYRMEWKCFPDTIDPGAPKAK